MAVELTLNCTQVPKDRLEVEYYDEDNGSYLYLTATEGTRYGSVALDHESVEALRDELNRYLDATPEPEPEPVVQFETGDLLHRVASAKVPRGQTYLVKPDGVLLRTVSGNWIPSAWKREHATSENFVKIA